MGKYRRFAFRGGEGEDGLINLTPLIDVVFVILIAFILIAPLLEVDHIDLALASEKSSEVPSGKNALKIYVRNDNSLYFGNRKVTFYEMENLLREAKKKAPQDIPQIFQDSRSHFGTYQKVKNAVEEAGFSQMDVILKPH